MRNQSTVAELIGTCVFSGVLWLSAFAAWRAGAYLALVAMASLALLSVLSIIDMVRQGLRQPTAFERFEAQLLLRFIVLAISGAAAVIVLYRAGYTALATIVLVLAVIGSLLSLNKLRSNRETSAGYKRRVGYHDTEQQRQDSDEE